MRKAPAWGCCVGFISAKLSKEETILMIMGARFPTVRESSEKYGMEKNETCETIVNVIPKS